MHIFRLAPAPSLACPCPLSRRTPIPTQALTKALKDFKGAVVTVSENEAFVAEISNEKWVVENTNVTIVQLRDAKAR